MATLGDHALGIPVILATETEVTEEVQKNKAKEFCLGVFK